MQGLRHILLARFRRAGVIAATLMALSEVVSASHANRRTALVIGNARYEASFGRLRNAGNDAEAMSRALRALGFSVIEKHNVTREQLTEAMREFQKTLPNAAIAIFYYAGHGLSIAGSNYLAPVKSGFQESEGPSLRFQAETRLFNAEEAVADMGAGGAACNIVILDACRALPATAATRGLRRADGLSEMTPPAGSLIAFAADHGQVAFDGDGRNGLFTEELLKHMRTPGLTIEQVFKRTREGVLARSAGAQIPAEYSRLIGADIFLAGAPGEADPPPAQTPPPPTPLASPPASTESLSLARQGDTGACLQSLRNTAHVNPADALLAMEILLETAKECLQNAEAPSPRVLQVAETCGAIQEILPEIPGEQDAQRKKILSKALNREGDALLLLDRPEEALTRYNQAIRIDREDAYLLYNRGRAHLALGKIEEAKSDFNAAAGPRYKQPRARQLAIDALQAME